MKSQRRGRALLVLAALAVLAAAGGHHLRRAQAQRALVASATHFGLDTRHPDVLAAIARETDSGQARLALARALLVDEIDTGWLSALSPAALNAEVARSPERLEVALGLAREELARRPASWQASMIVGGATYLRWSRERDRRLFRERAAWEEPMRAAVRLAPGNPEPRRLLGAAYLETWFALPADLRGEARELLRTAFEDPSTFERLIEPWLAIARDPVAAFAVVPEQPAAWRRLQSIFAQRQDWTRYTEARAAWERVLRRDLEARLTKAETHLDGGDLQGARQIFLGVAADLPVDLRYADLLERAMRRCPPGPASREASANLEDWIAITLELYLYEIDALPADIVGRLAGATGQLPPEDSALAALAAGRLAEAEAYERRTGALWNEAWGPYLIAKTRALAALGHYPEAHAALAETHRAWRGSAVYWRASEQVAAAEKATADREKALARLAELGRERWSGTTWRWRGQHARMEMLAARPAAALAVAIDVAPTGGSAVEVFLDGRSLGVFEAQPEGALERHHTDRGGPPPSGFRDRLWRPCGAGTGLAAGLRALDPIADSASLYAEHCVRGRFFCPWAPHTAGPLQVLRWKLAGNPRRAAKRRPMGAPVVPNDGASLRQTEPGGALTWVGHSTFAIHDRDDVVLTDPHWGPRALLPRRLAPPGIPLAAVPDSAFAVLSHNHYDHLDAWTVRRLPRMDWYVPLGVGGWLRRRTRASVVELDWWQSARRGRWTITSVPAQHWSNRLDMGRNRSLWCGWVLDNGERVYYFAGDTGYCHAFAEIGRRFPKIDVALLPIGAYEPRWFMRQQHMNPPEAWQAFLDLGADLGRISGRATSSPCTGAAST